MDRYYYQGCGTLFGEFFIFGGLVALILSVTGKVLNDFELTVRMIKNPNEVIDLRTWEFQAISWEEAKIIAELILVRDHQQDPISHARLACTNRVVWVKQGKVFIPDKDSRIIEARILPGENVQ